MENHADKLREAKQGLRRKTQNNRLLKPLSCVAIWFYIPFYLVKEAASEFGRNKAFIHGAALSYYTVFSLPPMLLIIIMAIGFFVGEEEVKVQIMSVVEENLGHDPAIQIKNVLEQINPHRKGFIATIVGFATLLFSSTVIFYTVKDSLNTFWRVYPVKGQSILMIIFNRLAAFLMVITLGVVLFVAVIFETLLVAFNRYFEDFLPDFFAQTLFYSHSSISFIVMNIIFAMIFKFLPDAIISWRDVFIGAFVTSILFVAGQIGIAWYLGNSNMADSYGAAGSVILILSWVFYSSQILYFGAEFTYVYAESLGQGVKQSRLSRRLNRLS